MVTTDNEAHVRLEFVAAVAIDVDAVRVFLQELRDVPRDAWCEVHKTWSKDEPRGIATASSPSPTSVAGQGPLRTFVHMSCERVVAEFLCERFSHLTRHISRGELLQVRCKRMHQRAAPMTRPSDRRLLGSADAYEDPPAPPSSTEELRQPVLPREVVVDMLDCLGDKIADVLDAFNANAAHDQGNSPRLSLLGLGHALDALCPPKEWKLQSNPKVPSRNTTPKAEAKEHTASRDPTPSTPPQAIRNLVQRLIARGSVAVRKLPIPANEPFLCYTDFIACYIAFVNSPPQR